MTWYNALVHDKSTDSLTDKLWVKRWIKSNDEPDLNLLVVTLYRLAQKTSTHIADNFYKKLLKSLSLTPYVTNIASLIRLKERDMVWEAPDAIHYQARIGNILCQDMEFAIKVDKDFGNVITELNYINNNKFPLNLSFEFRILKSSKALLSAAYDKDSEAYYFFPEVLSINDTKHYKEFCNVIVKR
ncbi:16377_t:CDS:2 [Funneliformis mosseae]|uniref:16377_t:CDS:1 n=1 Tax=Funneliformis mosseae TaxID=27381 RepID=A0A9N8ZW54_FUNMO|nr:16377_t:CDS:2 [Funneliformis mosseae]